MIFTPGLLLYGDIAVCAVYCHDTIFGSAGQL